MFFGIDQKYSVVSFLEKNRFVMCILNIMQHHYIFVFIVNVATNVKCFIHKDDNIYFQKYGQTEAGSITLKEAEIHRSRKERQSVTMKPLDQGSW